MFCSLLSAIEDIFDERLKLARARLAKEAKEAAALNLTPVKLPVGNTGKYCS